MAALDWSQFRRCREHPGQSEWGLGVQGHTHAGSGRFENLEDGMTVDEVMEQIPGDTGAGESCARIRRPQFGRAHSSTLMRVLFDNDAEP